MKVVESSCTRENSAAENQNKNKGFEFSDRSAFTADFELFPEIIYLDDCCVGCFLETTFSKTWKYAFEIVVKSCKRNSVNSVNQKLSHSQNLPLQPAEGAMLKNF